MILFQILWIQFTLKAFQYFFEASAVFENELNWKTPLILGEIKVRILKRLKQECLIDAWDFNWIFRFKICCPLFDN